MIKLTLSEGRGPILLNPVHILAFTESNTRPVTFVHMTDGKAYEVREPVVAIAALFPAGGAQ